MLRGPSCAAGGIARQSPCDSARSAPGFAAPPMHLAGSSKNACEYVTPCVSALTCRATAKAHCGRTRHGREKPGRNI